MEKLQLHSSPQILQLYVDKIDNITFDQASLAFDSSKNKYKRREYQFNKFCLVYAQQKKQVDLQKKKSKLKTLDCKKNLKKIKYLKKIFILKQEKCLTNLEIKKCRKIEFKKSLTNFFGKFYIRKLKSRKYKRLRKRGYISQLIKENLEKIYLNLIQENDLFVRYFKLKLQNNTTRIKRLTLLKIFNSKKKTCYNQIQL